MRRLVILVAVSMTLLAGCGFDSESVRIGSLPFCDHPNTGRFLLMAQSVPSAQLVPCIVEFPAGWTLEHADVESGQSRLQFDNPVGEDVIVFLLPACTLQGSRVETEPGLESYSDTTGRLRIDQHLFEGGCIRLEVPIDEDAEPMANAIGWVTRDWLRQESGWEL